MGAEYSVPENRFLQSFCALAASSVLVCGTLLLLTSTAPWTPPDLGSEPSTPDAARDFAEVMPPLDNDVADETVASPGSPLSPESADADPDTGSETANEIIAAVPEPVAEANLVVASPAPVPLAGDTAEAATHDTAGLLAELPPRVVASHASAAAAEEVAALAANLSPAPPQVIASEKTGAATEEVAGTAAGLLPAPQPLIAHAAVESAPEVTADVATAAAPVIGESRMAAAEFDDVSATVTAIPGTYVVADNVTTVKPLEAKPPASVTAMHSVERDLLEVEVVELLPPPMPRRKPEPPAAASIATTPPPEPEETTPVTAAAAIPPTRERPATQPAPQRQRAPSGGVFGFFNPAKPMALAPADHPATPSRPATARPSSGAYASQVWSRLARHKPRVGQRGSASVRFTIGEMGVLRAAQIARSSGNARIDQLALQTVRGAAPFPAPPSGAVSYTIRIDFQ